VSEKIYIEECVGADTDHAWIIEKGHSDPKKAVATCPAEALFIVTSKMGLEQVSMEGCCRLLGIGRRVAVEAEKQKHG
jgi:hypothetical protein